MGKLCYCSQCRGDRFLDHVDCCSEFHHKTGDERSVYLNFENRLYKGRQRQSDGPKDIFEPSDDFIIEYELAGAKSSMV